MRPGVPLLVLAVLLAFGGTGVRDASASAPWDQPNCRSTILLSVPATNEYAWNDTTLGPVCSTTNFTVTNGGSYPHSFTVSSLVNQTDPSTTDPSWFSAPNLLYNQPLNASSGGVPAVLHAVITFPSPGTYEFTCIPHYALGMYGEIYVGEPLPAGSGAPHGDPQSPYWYVVLAISVLGVLAVVGMVFGIPGRPRTETRTAAGPDGGSGNELETASGAELERNSPPTEMSEKGGPEA